MREEELNIDEQLLNKAEKEYEAELQKTKIEANQENNSGADASYMVKAEEITLDLIMHHTVKECQYILAKWIVPDSGISDKDCLTELLGVLDDQSLVRYMRFIEANLKDKDGKPLSIQQVETYPQRA